MWSSKAHLPYHKQVVVARSGFGTVIRIGGERTSALVSRERGFDRIRSPQVSAVLCREVRERQQFILILEQALYGFGILGLLPLFWRRARVKAVVYDLPGTIGLPFI